MRFLPLFLDLTSATVALIGAGPARATAAAVALGRRTMCAGTPATPTSPTKFCWRPSPPVSGIDLADPCQADFAEFAAVVAAAGALEQVAARARGGRA